MSYKDEVIFYMRTITEMSQLLQKLDHVVSTEFISPITRGVAPPNSQRKLLCLLTKPWGLDIPIFSELSRSEYNKSRLTAEHL